MDERFYVDVLDTKGITKAELTNQAIKQFADEVLDGVRDLPYRAPYRAVDELAVEITIQKALTKRGIE